VVLFRVAEQTGMKLAEALAMPAVELGWWRAYYQHLADAERRHQRGV
jgi:hypothetical protein